MAEVKTVRYQDDLDGTEFEPGADGENNIAFGIDGQSYEIDLTAGNAAKLRESLAEYIAAARRSAAAVPATPGKGRAARRTQTASQTADRAEKQAMREWARGKGFKVADRGRIPAEVIEAYRAECGSVPVTSVVEVQRERKANTNGGHSRDDCEDLDKCEIHRDPDGDRSSQNETGDGNATEGDAVNAVEAPAKREDVTDEHVIGWHEAKGYKVSRDKTGSPNGLMKSRYYRAHNL